MQEVFWAIGIVAILLIILIVLVSSTVRRVNVLVKNIFIDKLQEYDYLIDDKEKKIDKYIIKFQEKNGKRQRKGS